MPPKRATSKQDTTQQPTMVPLKPSTPTGTPAQSPSKRAVGITAAQKQALMDNVQLEISERARKLRAQYALQAQGLRARLEMRVNRIPQALRKRKMGELADECTEKERAREVAVSKRIRLSPEPRADQENQPPAQDLPNPKKRAATKPAPVAQIPTAATTAPPKPTRTNSRQNNPPQPTATTRMPPPSAVPSRAPNPAGVLSPRSHNAQSQPSQIQPPSSPDKSKTAPLSHATFAAARSALSPAKPALPQLSAQHANAGPSRSRTASRQAGPTAVKKAAGTTRAPPAKKAGAAKDGERRRSGESDEGTQSSVGTTIVNRAPAPAVAKKGAAAAKKTGGVRAAMRDAVDKGKKATGAGAGKKENAAPAPAAGGRVLRKRG